MKHLECFQKALVIILQNTNHTGRQPISKTAFHYVLLSLSLADEMMIQLVDTKPTQTTRIIQLFNHTPFMISAVY